MKATLFEFRNRRWFIIAIFLAAFQLDWRDREPSGMAVARRLAHHFPKGSVVTWTHAVFIFAAVILVVSAALRSWGTAYLQTAVMQSRTVVTDRLLADGPFRHVRNPLYLGNMFMAVGLGLAASPINFAGRSGAFRDTGRKLSRVLRSSSALVVLDFPARSVGGQQSALAERHFRRSVSLGHRGGSVHLRFRFQHESLLGSFPSGCSPRNLVSFSRSEQTGAATILSDPNLLAPTRFLFAFRHAHLRVRHGGGRLR
jgi:hypothetical protein